VKSSGALPKRTELDREQVLRCPGRDQRIDWDIPAWYQKTITHSGRTGRINQMGG
jgi:hypothetical protein